MSFRSFSVQGATIRGVEAVPVSVEVVISNGLPGFAIVGMADAAIQESRERVKAALRSSGFVMPNEKIVVNLAPGALRKTGSGFDLPIALGILAATGQMDPEVVRHALVVGELSLGGGVRCSAGMLAYQRCAAGLGLELIAGSPDEGFVKIEGLTCKFLERLSMCANHDLLMLLRLASKGFTLQAITRMFWGMRWQSAHCRLRQRAGTG